MEEIYTLLQERIESVDEVKKKSVQLDAATSLENFDKEIKDSEISDLTQAIAHAKRLEKFRIIKENELLEVIFGLKCFDSNQKLKFQAKSYEAMKNIRQDFVYEKYKYTGETKDIAKLYLNFFITLRLEGKVNDLKKAYANNKFMGYPIISALLKWLVEIARKYFQNFLEEKNKDILNWTLAKKKKAAMLASSAQKLAQSTILTRPQSTTKQRIQSQSRITTDQSKHRVSPDNLKEEIELDKYLVSGNNTNTHTNNEILISGSPKSSECKSALVAKSTKSLKEHARYGRSQTNPKEVSGNFEISALPDHAQLINSTNLKDMKSLRRGPELYKQHKNLVHIFVSPTNQANNNHLDVIEDLDLWQTNIMIPQLSSIQKTIKKNRESHLVTIDLEKKKELVTLVYRTLYYRNLDIERTVTNYQTKLSYLEKAEYEPINKARKGENFCENYAINFRRRFPHVVCNVSNSHLHHHASKHHRVKLSKGRSPLVLSLAQANQSHDTVLNDSPQLPVCPLSPKNIKPMSSKTLSKKEAESPLIISKVQSGGVNNPVLNEVPEQNQNSSQRVNQDSFSESPTKLSDVEEVYSKKKGSPGLGFGYRSEHHFRIKKRVSVLHETKPETEKAFKSMMSKPSKLEHPINWGNSEGILAKIDNPSDRNSLPQTVSSRREMSNGFSKNHPEETFNRQKVMRTSLANHQKMRLWSTEKSKHPSTLEDLTAKSVVHAKSSYNHLEEPSSYKSKEEVPQTEEDAIQIKAVYGSHLVSPKHEKHEEGHSNIDSVDCTKVNCCPSFQDHSGEEVDETAEQGDNLKGKNSNTKPLKIILKLYPKHHKYYSEPFNIPQREKS